MSQATLLKNMEKYLRLRGGEAHALADKIHHSEGVCFSLALIRAVMKSINKSKYWDNLLVAANNWDGEAKSLGNDIRLPETDNEIPVKLNVIFERLINYVLINQADHSLLPDNFQIAGYSQHKYLLPEQKQFEMLVKSPNTGENELKHIAKRNHVGGNFTNKQLGSLLNKDMLATNICIVGSRNHAIQASYVENKWILYNPNFNHRSTQSMIKEYKDKKLFLKEIQRILGNTVNIEVATLDARQSVDIPNYENLVIKYAKTVLMDNGWLQIYQTQKHLLPKIIQNAMSTQAGMEVIFEEITQAKPGEISFLDVIINNSPESMTKLIDFASRSKSKSIAIAKCLSLTGNIGDTPLHSAVNFDRKHFFQLLQVACHYPLGREYIASTCDKNDSDGLSGFFAVLQNDDKSFPLYLDAITQSKQAGQRLLNAFNSEVNIDKSNGLTFAAKTVPHLLPRMFDMVLQTRDGLQQSIKAFMKNNDKEYSAADVIDELERNDIKKDLLNIFINNLHRYDLKALTETANQLIKIVPKPKQGVYKDKLRFFVSQDKNPPILEMFLISVKNEMANRLTKPKKIHVEEAIEQKVLRR